MRTEDELRAALTALERHAPVAARVLPGSNRRSSRRMRSPKAIGWLAGAATAAAVAGAVTALILPGGTDKAIPNGGLAPSAPVTVTTLRAKLLAAFSANTEIVYMRGTYQTIAPDTDPSPATDETWYYPGQPSIGQPVRIRTMSVQAGFGHTDVGLSYLEPAQKTGLAFPPPQVKGERISVDYAAKTWSDAKDALITVFGLPYKPALIASYFKSKQWSELSTTLNGRPAIELTFKEVDRIGKTIVNGWTEYLWVDASTYLPLHDVTTFGGPKTPTHAVEDFQYLPPTPANLAKLTPSIPAGFRQVTPPSPPISATPAGPLHSI